MKYPQQPKLLIHSDKRQRQDGQYFDTVREAFDSEFARVLRCPVCGKKVTLDEGGYVRQTADKYIGLAKCSHHGLLLIRVRLRPQQGGGLTMSMTLSKAAPSNRAYVNTKRIQMQARDVEYEQEHGHPRDLDKELQMVERSSMPFED